MNMNVQTDLFALAEINRPAPIAEQLRNEKTRQVINNSDPFWNVSFRKLAQEYFLTLSVGDKFIGENIRTYVTARGLAAPHHPNVWGAVIRSVIVKWTRDGLIEMTGGQKSADAKSHACWCPLYTKRAA